MPATAGRSAADERPGAPCRNYSPVARAPVRGRSLGGAVVGRCRLDVGAGGGLAGRVAPFIRPAAQWADSSGGGNTSIMEVLRDGSQSATEGDVADAGQDA